MQQLLAGEPPAGLDRLPVLKLSPRQQCDVEMLLSGAFSPLAGFLGRDDYLAVLQTAHLADGTLWPVPVVLDVDGAALAALRDADRLLLLDAELHPVAVLELGEAWQPDRAREAKILYGTDDVRHDGVRHLLHETRTHFLGGRLRGLRLPVCRFQARYRRTPAEQRAATAAAGGRAMAWFICAPPQRAELSRLAAALVECDADQLLLLHSPHVAPAGVPNARVTAHCLAALLPRLAQLARVSYCSVAWWPRWCGTREEVWRAIVAQNYGAASYRMNAPCSAAARVAEGIAAVARDDDPLLQQARQELAIRLVAPPAHVRQGGPRASGAGAARDVGEADAEEQLPEVAAILRRRGERGFALFLTGLSGAGKSSLAHGLAEAIEARYGRAVTVLDGDYSRRLLTSDLTETPVDQFRNVERHAYVGAQVVLHGGIAVIALVAPYAAARAAARRMVEAHGGFVEVYLCAPVDVCEARDTKGIYARIKSGFLGAATNIAEHYEVPAQPDFVADASRYDSAALVAQLLAFLARQGHLPPLPQDSP